MSVKRRDSKNHILRNGESQRADGRYAYVYVDGNGKQKFIYSWKLESTDKVPQGKRDCISLREKIKMLKKDLDDGIVSNGGGMTVLQLVEKYTAQKRGVRLGTKSIYHYVIQILNREPFGLSVNDDMDNRTVIVALNRLSEYLYRYYGRKVIILLDEYDAPMHEAYLNGYWDELVSFTRSLFNAAFKSNPYLERAIMTGVTRVSKESVFSDLNNLKVITTTSKYKKAGAF